MPQAQPPPKKTRWRFKIGALVDHKGGDMLSFVLWRGRTFNGEQMYGLVDESGKMRFFRGSYLVRA